MTQHSARTRFRMLRMRYLLLAGLTACFAATGADGADRAATLGQSSALSGASGSAGAQAGSSGGTVRDVAYAAPKDTVDSLQAVRRATVLDTLGRARAALAPKGGASCPH